jgi:hypothetical protein
MQEFYRRAAAPWLTFIINTPEVSMDIFLVLTGFLAGVALIPDLEKSRNRLSVIQRYN